MSTNSFSGTPWEATAMRSVPWKVAALSRSTKRAATILRDLSSMMACRYARRAGVPTKGPNSVSACQMPFTRAASNARRSFCCPGPAGSGWALNQRRMVAADSSPSAT